jgi:hypothetical protein
MHGKHGEQDMRIGSRLRTAAGPLLLAALAVFSAATQAAVIYEFEGTVGRPPMIAGGGFTYTSAGLILTDRNVPASALDECHVTLPTAQCNGVVFQPDFLPGYDVISFSFLNTGYHVFYFADGALSQFGTYGPAIPTLGNLATLIVRDASVVPEPSTIALLLCGLVLVTCLASLRRCGHRQ